MIKTRIYIPLEKEKITGYISDTHKEIDNFLKENDCELIDYVKGKAKFNNSKNETTIGKLLTRFKNDVLNNKFQSDEKRKALTSTEKEDLLVVISRHPYDIAGSDTDRNWTNCMTIGTDNSNRLTKLMDEYEKTKDQDIKYKIANYKANGANIKYLIHEVKEGSLISYLIKSSDKNINNPLAVLNIKPYTKDDKVMLSTSSNMYGVKRPEFKNTVDFVLKYFNKDVKGGLYNINKKVYNDDSGFRINYDNLSTDKICEILNIKNYTLENGLVNVHGGVDLRNKGFIKLPLKFGKVDGYFNCNSNQLTSLEGATQSVDGYFICDNNQLTTLEGCPQSVGSDFSCYHNQLTSLEGAPQSVGGNFYCYNNQLTTLEGAPQSVVRDFRCSNNKLTSLEGAPQSVGGGFYCEGNKLKSLDGSPVYIKNDFNCSFNNNDSFLEIDKPSFIKGRFINNPQRFK